MNINVNSFYICSIETLIVIAADEYFVLIGQITKPVEEVNGLSFLTNHTEVAGTNHDVGIRQIIQPMMHPVRIRKMQDFHILNYLRQSYQMALTNCGSRLILYRDF